MGNTARGTNIGQTGNKPNSLDRGTHLFYPGSRMSRVSIRIWTEDSLFLVRTLSAPDQDSDPNVSLSLRHVQAQPSSYTFSFYIIITLHS